MVKGRRHNLMMMDITSTINWSVWIKMDTLFRESIGGNALDKTKENSI